MSASTGTDGRRGGPGATRKECDHDGRSPVVCRHRLGEPEPPGLPGRCRRSVFGNAPWRTAVRGSPSCAIGCWPAPEPDPRRSRWRSRCRRVPSSKPCCNAGFACMRSIPSSSIDSATASPSPVPRAPRAPRACPREGGDDRRDARVLAGSLRTDRHAFRPLSADDPVIVERRGWSRMADDLQQERNRLANRVREQLWRYYPQMLELADDLAADWFFDLWSQAPTPAKAARLRQTTIERFLKAHRICRWQAPEVWRILKQKPLSVAPGVVEAATAHIRSVTARIRLVNQQLKAAHRKLDQLCDQLCDQLIPPEENAPGQGCEQRDVVILRSMPGLGRINLAVLLATGQARGLKAHEAWQPLGRRDYHALRCLSGVAPVTGRSGKTCVVVRRYACNKRLENALDHWARVALQHDEPSRRRYAALRQRRHSHGRAPAHRRRPPALRRLHPARTADPVRPRLQGSGGRRRVSVLVPSLCSIENDHPFVPTCRSAEHRAQRQSRMPPAQRRHRQSRRAASLTERARCYPPG